MRRKKLDFEIEETLVDLLCDRNKISVDVGAADGRYTRRMLEHSSRVVAFEPYPLSAAALRVLFKFAPSVLVEQMALSNYNGIARLSTPSASSKLSSIEIENRRAILMAETTNMVVRKRLDSYGLSSSVGFIKIDVEGHEMAVLEGATNTIDRSRPNILVEVIEWHNPGSFSRVKAFLAAKGYFGFFIYKKKLLSIDEFVAAEHQKESADILQDRYAGLFVSNFLFLPNKDLRDRLEDRLK